MNYENMSTNDLIRLATRWGLMVDLDWTRRELIQNLKFYQYESNRRLIGAGV